MTFTTTYRTFARILAALTIGAMIATVSPFAAFAEEIPAEPEQTIEAQTNIETELKTETDLFNENNVSDIIDDFLGGDDTNGDGPDTSTPSLGDFDLPSFNFDSFDDFLEEFDFDDFFDFDQQFCTEEEFDQEFLNHFGDLEDVLNNFGDNLFDFICNGDNEPDPDPDPEPQDEVVVHIYKYLEDEEGDLALATEGSFDFTATWQADNLNNGSSTTGNFTLDDGNDWHAVTAVMDAGADYTVSEVMNDDVLESGATCTEGTHRLVGYKWGGSLAQAQNDSIDDEAPDFENLVNDRYVIVVNEDCDDVLNPDPDPDPEPEMCTIWSDEGTMIGSNPAVPTFVHGSWTTEFDNGDAEWIWSTATVTDPTTEETVTFTKTFTASATTSDATLRVAADNSYTATLNGDPITGCDGSNNDNHSDADTCMVSLENGTNTLEFVVTNDAGDANPEVNPAGLIFDLSWEADSCDGSTNPDPEEPEMCTLEIVSDASNRSGDGAFAVLVETLSSGWDAMVDGARWIWGEDPIADPVNETNETFTKSFNWSGDLADLESATLEIASDNTYAVTLNGSTTASSTDADNYSDETEYDVTDLIEMGTNDLSILVTNLAEENGTAESNPAGLLYKLTVVGGNNSCTNDGGNDNSNGDTYLIYGYVWNDEDEDEDFEEDDENGVEGISVTASNGDTTYTDTTNSNGYYEIEVPAGTWTVSQVDTDDWEQTTSSGSGSEAYPVNENGDYVVTVPVEDDEDLEVALAFPLNLFMGVAQAAVVDTIGPLSFGIRDDDDRRGGGGDGRRSSSSSGGSISRSSSNDDDDGEVLGAQTSIIPIGGANAGGGGTAQGGVTYTFQLVARPEQFARVK